MQCRDDGDDLCDVMQYNILLMKVPCLRGCVTEAVNGVANYDDSSRKLKSPPLSLSGPLYWLVT